MKITLISGRKQIITQNSEIIMPFIRHEVVIRVGSLVQCGGEEQTRKRRGVHRQLLNVRVGTAPACTLHIPGRLHTVRFVISKVDHVPEHQGDHGA